MKKLKQIQITNEEAVCRFVDSLRSTKDLFSISSIGSKYYSNSGTQNEFIVFYWEVETGDVKI